MGRGYMISASKAGLVGRPGRGGFTLFEVAISLVIVSLGVISVIMFYPMGIKSQQLARFQLLACAKAEEMIDVFNIAHDSQAAEHEGLGPWDVPLAYKSHVHDLETRLSTPRHGLVPLPMTIARRLESDNDEIQSILNAGGRLYYSHALGTTGIDELHVKMDMRSGTERVSTQSNETQKLIIAVTGYAQHNNVAIFPWKAWPYYTAYPSPPYMASVYTKAFSNNNYWSSSVSNFLPPWARIAVHGKLASNSSSNQPGTVYCWEAVTPGGTSIPGADADVLPVFNAFWKYAYGDDPMYGPTSGGGHLTEASAVAYVQAALKYAQDKGLGPDFYNPPTPIPNPVGDFVPGTLNPITLEDEQHTAWKQVQAMRFLSHAATCLTKLKTLAQLGGQPSNPANGLAIPASATGSPAITLTHDLIVYYHERCTNLIMRYTASFPYDWGAPRNTARFQMMDFPLIEYDLFERPLNGKVFSGANPSSSTIAATQWKPLPAKKIYNVGVSYHYPSNFLPYSTLYSGGAASMTMPDGSLWPRNDGRTYANSGAYKDFWGNPSHSTLTKPFTPAERCRQIVFWAVDWQAYEDCETAPSASIDAAKYPVVSSFMGMTLTNRVDQISWGTGYGQNFRNPETLMAYITDVSSWRTGADVTAYTASFTTNSTGGATPDKGLGAGGYNNGVANLTVDRRQVFSGLYGADRNYNQRLDRGPVPTSVRMRATSVARFNYYDPRMTLSLR